MPAGSRSWAPGAFHRPLECWIQATVMIIRPAPAASGTDDSLAVILGTFTSRRPAPPRTSLLLVLACDGEGEHGACTRSDQHLCARLERRAGRRHVIDEQHPCS